MWLRSHSVSPALLTASLWKGNFRNDLDPGKMAAHSPSACVKIQSSWGNLPPQLLFLPLPWRIGQRKEVTHPFIHVSAFIGHLLCAWQGARHWSYNDYPHFLDSRCFRRWDPVCFLVCLLNQNKNAFWVCGEKDTSILENKVHDGSREYSIPRVMKP